MIELADKLDELADDLFMRMMQSCGLRWHKGGKIETDVTADLGVFTVVSKTHFHSEGYWTGPSGYQEYEDGVETACKKWKEKLHALAEEMRSAQ